MWRDPLDELIEDLEHVTPDPPSACGDMFPLVKLQDLADAILYGTRDQVEALKADPAYQQWVRRCSEARRQSE